MEACLKGHAESCAGVGYMYELGYCGLRDRRTAIKFFSQAGTLGDEHAGQVAKVLARPETPVFRRAEEIGTYVGKVIGPAYLNGTLPDAREPTKVTGGTVPLPSNTQPVVVGGSAESLWKACQQTYLRLDHAGAVPLCRRAAEAGSAIATYQMGYFYEHGDGVPQNHAKAVEWFLRGAAKGESKSMNALGYFYEDGMGGGLREDWVKAAQYYQESANLGNVKAEYNMRRAYEFGIGVACNLEQAVVWYEKSERDGPRAQEQVSWLRGNRFRFDGHHRNEQENAVFSGVWQGDMTVPAGRLFKDSAERMAYLRGAAGYARSVNADGARREAARKKSEYDKCMNEGGGSACGAPPIRAR
jgi:TPR repeat protein